MLEGPTRTSKVPSDATMEKTDEHEISIADDSHCLKKQARW
jgi:hypothetical protein